MSFLVRNVPGRTTSFLSFLMFLIFLPLFILAVQQTVQLLTRATGTRASIVVDTKAIVEPVRTDFYHAFSQGGEEAVDMIAPIRREVSALKPKFIRIDHIYDYYDVVSGSGAGLAFNWARLDEVVGTITATGATPVLALSYMPAAIAKNGNIINVPDNWDDWSLVVQKTIEHYSGKSAKNLTNVHYEVWNEPDLASFGSWRLSGEKNYLTLYRYAAKGAANAANVHSFSLGGPATTGLYKNWILALVRSGVRLDFLSWHSYLSDPRQFAVDQRNVVSWLLPYPSYTLIPKFITEFGFSGNKNGLYATSYAAAFTASVVKELYTGGPAYLFSFELTDGPGQTDNSGWGLITHQDNGLRKKPRYYVYNFLDQMAGTRLTLSGEGTFVTAIASTNDEIIRLLLVNHNPYRSWSENVPVSFTNMEPGEYTVRTKFLLGRESSGVATVSGGLYTTQLYMPSESVVMIELSPKPSEP